MIIANENELMSSVARELPLSRRALVLAPHPDDEVFGCGGALALLQEAGVNISILVLTDGALGGDNSGGAIAAIRENESLVAATILGLAPPIFWRKPDRGLHYGELLIKCLSEAIEDAGADLVFLPSPTELHPDHQTVAFAGAEALRRLGGGRQAIFYELNAPLANPNLLIDISRVWEKKQQAMRCFRSQLADQPYDKRIEGLNCYRAFFLGQQVTNAEAFVLATVPELPEALSSLFAGPLVHRRKQGFAVCGSDIPLVSIVVRSMDRPTLAEALDSIALQTWLNIEVVVVNAKGGDHGHLGDYCGRFPLRIVNQGGEGLSRVRAANVGLIACLGKFISFLDDDDSIDPDHIYYLLKALNDTHAVAYAGVRGMRRYDPAHKEIVRFAEAGVGFPRLLLGNIIPIHAVLFSASLLKKGIRFDETLDLYEDWDFWLQIAREVPFIYNDRLSATYYAGGDSAVGLGEEGNAEIMHRARSAVAGKWLAQMTPDDLNDIGELYRLTKGGYEVRIATLNEAVGALEAKNATLNESVGELEAKNATLNESVGALEAKNATLNESVVERDVRIANLNKTIEKQDSRIRYLQQEVSARETNIASLLDSSCWKITQPVRFLGHNLKRLKRVAELILPTLQLGGGWKQTLAKGVRLYRKDGVEGIKRGFRFVASSAQTTIPQGVSLMNVLGAITRRADQVLALRVLIVAELSIKQCEKYRVTQKQNMLTGLGIECTVHSWTDTNACLNALESHSFVIFYRVPAFPSVMEIINEAKRLSVLTAWEVDDLIFDREVLAGSKTLQELEKDVFFGLLEGAVLYRNAMLACDFGIASTSGLAAAMRQAGVPDVFVVENALDDQTIAVAAHLTEVPRLAGDVVRIVYGSGTSTHNVDFLEAAAALLHVLKAFPNVRLRIVGSLDLPEDFAEVSSQVERNPLCDYPAYLKHINECDISIAPLEHYVFNDAKSNIKFLEASILGIPSICSPRAAFVTVIDHGANGFLCETPDEWQQALILLVNDASLRENIGGAAYASVMSKYHPSKIAEQQLLPIVEKKSRSRDKKRVLAVNIYYHPRSFGGATVVAEELNRLLTCRDDIEMYVFTSLPVNIVKQYQIRRYEVYGVSVFGMGLASGGESRDQFENPHVVEAFAEVVAAVRPDLVHFHCIQNIGVSTVDYCIKKKIPYVVTLHDAWWLCGRQFMVNRDGNHCNQLRVDLSACARCVDDANENAYRQQKLRVSLQKADRLLAPSNFFADFHVRNGFDADSVVVNKNGVRRPLAQKRVRRVGPIVFGYVGGNTEIKGVHLVKRVFMDLERQNVKLVVVDNTTNVGFSSFSRDFFSGVPRYEIIPAYTQDTIDDFFAYIDVLLFPTQCKESFGLTVREALARNVWVIVTDAGGVVEDIVDGKNGFIIPFGDQGEALRNAVANTVNHFERYAPGTEVAFDAKTITFFEEQAEDLANIYQAVISEQTSMATPQ